MSKLVDGAIGFAPTGSDQLLPSDLDQKIYRTATDAARRKFSPEFMNRVDKVVVFRGLRHEELRRIVDLELESVQQRIDEGATERFTITATPAAREFLLAEGTDYRYGARHLKRAIERFVVHPLANLSATRQVRLGDVVILDVDRSGEKLACFRDDGETSLAAAALQSAHSLRVNLGDRIAA
jgi:ATP-dependent Clp protease ATP-binding subunit ClpA